MTKISAAPRIEMACDWRDNGGDPRSFASLRAGRLPRAEVYEGSFALGSKAGLYQGLIQAVDRIWRVTKTRLDAYENNADARAEIHMRLSPYAARENGSNWKHSLVESIEKGAHCNNFSDDTVVRPLNFSLFSRECSAHVAAIAQFAVEDFFQNDTEVSAGYEATRNNSMQLNPGIFPRTLLPGQGFPTPQYAFEEAFRVQGGNCCRVISDALLIGFMRDGVKPDNYALIGGIITSAVRAYATTLAPLHVQVFNQIVMPVNGVTADKFMHGPDGPLGLFPIHSERGYWVDLDLNNSNSRVRLHRRVCHPVAAAPTGTELERTIGCPAFLARIDGKPVSTLFVEAVADIICKYYPVFLESMDQKLMHRVFEHQRSENMAAYRNGTSFKLVSVPRDMA